MPFIADKKVDVRGLTCPYTFVKSKLSIESMEPGQVLEIILDSDEAFLSIQKSMNEHGHSVVLAERIGDVDKHILVRKDSR